MRFDELKEIIKKNNIPENVLLRSDGGWECSATEMDGAYYNRVKNEIVFTQEGRDYNSYRPNNGWELIASIMDKFGGIEHE